MPARRSWPGAKAMRWTTSSAWPGTRGWSRRSAGSWPTPKRRRSGGAAQPARFAEVPLCHPHKLVPQAPGDRARRSTCPASPTRASWCASQARHLLGPDRLRARLLPEGQHGEHDQGAAARSRLRPERRRRELRAAQTSSGSSSPPSPGRSSSLRSQACAARHPPGPRHRRNAAAHAPHVDRRAASRSRCEDPVKVAKPDSCTPVGRRLRTRPRPIARRNDSGTPFETPVSSRSSGDALRRRTKKARSGSRLTATLAPRKHGRRAACRSGSTLLPRPERTLGPNAAPKALSGDCVRNPG